MRPHSISRVQLAQLRKKMDSNVSLDTLLALPSVGVCIESHETRSSSYDRTVPCIKFSSSCSYITWVTSHRLPPSRQLRYLPTASSNRRAVLSKTDSNT